MADHAVYVYAVGDAVLAEAADRSSIRGVDGSQVRVVVEGGLAALVGSVDRERFSEESLSHRLKDVRWLAETARAHDTVITTVARTHAVVPLRMATVYVDDDNVRMLLRENTPGFTDALDEVRGCTEWGVKAFAIPDPVQGQPPASTETKPGTSYLMRRRSARDRAATVRQEAMDAAEAVHRTIAGLAFASHRYQPQDPRLAGHDDDMVLNAAYLVDEPGAKTLRQTVDRVNIPRLRLELTGPWAPYSFARLAQP